MVIFVGVMKDVPGAHIIMNEITFWVLACASSLRAPYVTVLHYRRKNFSTLNFNSFSFLLFVLKKMKMKNVIVYISDS